MSNEWHGTTYPIVPGHEIVGRVTRVGAAVTTYSPMRHWGVAKGKKVGVTGLGGVGHMGVKFARVRRPHGRLHDDGRQAGRRAC